MNINTVSLIGCGWLGLPLAQQLVAAGYIVKGSTTTPEKLPLLAGNGILAYPLQLQPHPVGELSPLLDADLVIINVPPKAGRLGNEFHPRQIQYLADAIQQSQVQWVIYISSTSVYPEQNRIVVEDDVTSSGQSAAPALVQAEQLLQALAPKQGVTIVRCAGLMGYDRIPGKYVAGRTVDSGAVPVNYLHRDDAVGLLMALVRQPFTTIFNAVAPLHPTREAVYRQSCVEFGYTLPTFVNPSAPSSFKIIEGSKLVNVITYSFRYPDPLGFYYEKNK